jgi:N-acetylglucosaminyl-diphospho-decaprenol L-rhamnosyltransferase
MTLLIVIVNYRTTSLTLDCLRSLVDEVETVAGTRVIVTDNASGDDSVERLEATVAVNGWGDWATIQPLGHNGGFAAGNNAAIRPALVTSDSPKYVLLLNPDTIVRLGALRALISFMEDHPDVGIAGSRLEEPDGTPQRSAFRFPSVLGELEGGLRLGLVSRLLARWVVAPDLPADPGPTDWVAGACMIIRSIVFETIGLMDEGYFMYFEEVDFCHRAIRAGWPCWYVPGARVVHLVGQSSGVTDPRTAQRRRPDYWFRARHRYFLANYGHVETVLANLAWSLGHAAYRLRRLVQRKPDTDPQWLLWDFIRFNFLLCSVEQSVFPGYNNRAKEAIIQKVT